MINYLYLQMYSKYVYIPYIFLDEEIYQISTSENIRQLLHHAL